MPCFYVLGPSSPSRCVSRRLLKVTLSRLQHTLRAPCSFVSLGSSFAVMYNGLQSCTVFISKLHSDSFRT